MKVNAIDSSNISTMPVSAVRRVNRHYNHNNEVLSLNKGDSYAPTQQNVTEQKYELACRVAAYYKTQYENLLKEGSCVV